MLDSPSLDALAGSFILRDQQVTSAAGQPFKKIELDLPAFMS
jgi:hypothetical protein